MQSAATGVCVQGTCNQPGLSTWLACHPRQYVSNVRQADSAAHVNAGHIRQLHALTRKTEAVTCAGLTTGSCLNSCSTAGRTPADSITAASLAPAQQARGPSLWGMLALWSMQTLNGKLLRGQHEDPLLTPSAGMPAYLLPLCHPQAWLRMPCMLSAAA